jgi:integrase/recombinase XerD
MLDRRLSARTIEQRASFAEARMRQWGTWDVSPDQLRGYLSAYAGHTLRTYFDHFRALYAWLVSSGRMDASPLDELKRPPTPKPKPRPLSRDDARRALMMADGDLRSYLMLGRFAGLRAHEIAKFSGEDIDAEALYVFGKGGQAAIIPTHPALWELAQNYPRVGHWFPSERSATGHVTAHAVTMRVSRHFDRLGIDGSSHRNRHLYGTELLRAGANLRVVQELMRHADLATTVRYLGVDQEEKVAAIRRLIA